MMDLCSIRDVDALLKRHGFHFRKSLGQNFLCDSTVPARIAEMCGADGKYPVFEIGPGIGALTRELASVSPHVLSMELDRSLLPILEETLSDLDNTEVVYGDAMKTDIAALTGEHFGGVPSVACANLPYYITTPAVTALIEARCFKSVTVMVQKEVAARMTASAGTADYGAFSVYIASHASPKILFDVPADCFIPRPKVNSAVVRLDILDSPPFPVDDMDFYEKTVRAAFAQRRKTLVNSLSSVFSPEVSREQLSEAVKAVGLSEKIRGERLSPAEFSLLASEIYKYIKMPIDN